MGQARQRGTFEQRQAEGAVKRADRLAANEAKRAEYEASRTLEERDRSRRANLLLTSVLGQMVERSMARGIEMARITAEYRKSTKKGCEPY